MVTALTLYVKAEATGGGSRCGPITCGRGCRSTRQRSTSSQKERSTASSLLERYGLPCPDNSWNVYELLDPPPVLSTVVEMDWPGFSTPSGKNMR